MCMYMCGCERVDVCMCVYMWVCIDVCIEYILYTLLICVCYRRESTSDVYQSVAFITDLCVLPTGIYL